MTDQEKEEQTRKLLTSGMAFSTAVLAAERLALLHQLSQEIDVISRALQGQAAISREDAEAGHVRLNVTPTPIPLPDDDACERFLSQIAEGVASGPVQHVMDAYHDAGSALMNEPSWARVYPALMAWLEASLRQQLLVAWAQGYEAFTGLCEQAYNLQRDAATLDPVTYEAMVPASTGAFDWSTALHCTLVQFCARCDAENTDYLRNALAGFASELRNHGNRYLEGERLNGDLVDLISRSFAAPEPRDHLARYGTGMARKGDPRLCFVCKEPLDLAAPTGHGQASRTRAELRAEPAAVKGAIRALYQHLHGEFHALDRARVATAHLARAIFMMEVVRYAFSQGFFPLVISPQLLLGVESLRKD